MEWSDVLPAGAFVVGAVAGSIATIRIMRWVLDYMRSERDEHDDPERRGPRRRL